MTLARLLTAWLVFCCLPALAQDKQSPSSSPSTLRVRVHSTKGLVLGEAFLFPYSSARPAEPWMIFSDRSVDLGSGQNALDPPHLDQYKLDQTRGDAHARHFKIYPLPATLVVDSNGPTCYAIRSYVVARDSKDSDSTHPAGYSTCQPSNRYQVKSADLRVVSGDR
jgi:hypothetical protein